MLVGSKMAFCGGKGLWKMLVHEFEGETRPSGKVSRLDSLCPSGDNRIARAAVDLLDKVVLGGHIIRVEINVAKFV